MKILCIAEEIGKSAPGIVYATILNELSKFYDIDLVCPDIYPGSISSKINILTCKQGLGNRRVNTYSLKFFGTSIFDLLIFEKCHLSNNIEKYFNKIVLCLLDSSIPSI